jgi:hypothetical protein
MTSEQIEALGPAFSEYLQQFLFCCDYTQRLSGKKLWENQAIFRSFFGYLNWGCLLLASGLARRAIR